MLAQQLRLGHDGAVVAVAPLPGEALPVAEEVEVQNVHHVPDLAAVVVDGCAGQADAVLAGLRQQTGGAVLAGAVAAQLLNLVEDHRAEAALGQHVLPAPQQQVVNQIDIRLGQGIGLQAPDYVYPQLALFIEEARDLALPVAQQVGWSHDDRRIGRRGGQKRQRLHRLAQAHVVRQQTAPRGQEEGQTLLLEVQQLPGEALRRGIGILRHFAGLLPANRVLPGLLQCAVPALPVGLAHLQRIAQHQPVQVADHPPVRREARNAPTPTVTAGEEALGQLRHAGLGLDRPALRAPVVGQRAVAVTAAVRIPQVEGKRLRRGLVPGKGEFKEIVQCKATPHRRLSATTCTGFPQMDSGRWQGRCSTTTMAVSCVCSR